MKYAVHPCNFSCATSSMPFHIHLPCLLVSVLLQIFCQTIIFRDSSELCVSQGRHFFALAINGTHLNVPGVPWRFTFLHSSLHPDLLSQITISGLRYQQYTLVSSAWR